MAERGILFVDAGGALGGAFQDEFDVDRAVRYLLEWVRCVRERLPHLTPLWCFDGGPTKCRAEALEFMRCNFLRFKPRLLDLQRDCAALLERVGAAVVRDPAVDARDLIAMANGKRTAVPRVIATFDRWMSAAARNGCGLTQTGAAVALDGENAASMFRATGDRAAAIYLYQSLLGYGQGALDAAEERGVALENYAQEKDPQVLAALAVATPIRAWEQVGDLLVSGGARAALKAGLTRALGGVRVNAVAWEECREAHRAAWIDRFAWILGDEAAAG